MQIIQHREASEACQFLAGGGVKPII